MRIEDIHVDQCYVNNRKRKGLVRKVLRIENDRVHYKFLSGLLFRKGLFYNSTTLKGFASWAESPIEELDDYSHLMGFVPQKNYSVLNVAGEEIFKCQEKKVNFYLRKNLLRKIDENTFQLTTDQIEQKLLAIHNGQIPAYAMTEKNICCVVCGTKNHLTKHHVIPKKDLPFYPLELKSNLSNRLPICRRHHDAYEIIKLSFTPEGYTQETAIKWMEHFIESMEPEFMPKGWHILGVMSRFS